MQSLFKCQHIHTNTYISLGGPSRNGRSPCPLACVTGVGARATMRGATWHTQRSREIDTTPPVSNNIFLQVQYKLQKKYLQIMPHDFRKCQFILFDIQIITLLSIVFLYSKSQKKPFTSKKLAENICAAQEFKNQKF